MEVLNANATVRKAKVSVKVTVHTRGLGNAKPE